MHEIINTGLEPNDGRGDAPRVMAEKVNRNFEQLFGGAGAQRAVEIALAAEKPTLIGEAVEASAIAVAAAIAGKADRTAENRFSATQHFDAGMVFGLVGQGFYAEDSTDPLPVARAHCRFFVGDAGLTGNFAGNQGGRFAPTSADGADWGLRDAQFVAVSNNGLIAITGASRSSMGVGGRVPAHFQSAIGVGGFVICDVDTVSGWAMYSDVQRERPVAAYNLEMASKNLSTNSLFYPGIVAHGAVGIWAAAGGDKLYVGPAKNPSQCSFIVGANGSTWNTGIGFQWNSLTGTDGKTGFGEAISMSTRHVILWRAPDNNSQTASITSVGTDGTRSTGLIFDDSVVRVVGSGGRSIMDFADSIGSVNHIGVANAGPGGRVAIYATGADANIDLAFGARGAGRAVFYSPLHLDSTGEYLDRGSQITLRRRDHGSTGVAFAQHIFIETDGDGDGQTLKGAGGIYVRVGDRPGITRAQRGYKNGITIEVVPIFDSENFPFDDAAPLNIANGGTGRAPEAVYVGRGVHLLDNEFSAAFGVDAWTRDLIHTSGRHEYGINFNYAEHIAFGGAVVSRAVLYTPPSTTIIRARNVARSGDVDVLATNANDEIVLGSGIGGVVVGPGGRVTAGPLYIGNTTGLDFGSDLTIVRSGPASAGVKFRQTIISYCTGYGADLPPDGDMSLPSFATAGQGGMYIVSEDAPGVADARRGMLYGVAISIRPHYERRRYPYDDAVPIVIGNDGTATATEAIYLGRGEHNLHRAFSAVIGNDANTKTYLSDSGKHDVFYDGVYAAAIEFGTASFTDTMFRVAAGTHFMRSLKSDGSFADLMGTTATGGLTLLGRTVNTPGQYDPFALFTASQGAIPGVSFNGLCRWSRINGRVVGDVSATIAAGAVGRTGGIILPLPLVAKATFRDTEVFGRQSDTGRLLIGHIPSGADHAIFFLADNGSPIDPDNQRTYSFHFDYEADAA